jgi:hypothetical protein
MNGEVEEVKSQIEPLSENKPLLEDVSDKNL